MKATNAKGAVYQFGQCVCMYSCKWCAVSCGGWYEISKFNSGQYTPLLNEVYMCVFVCVCAGERLHLPWSVLASIIGFFLGREIQQQLHYYTRTPFYSGPPPCD